MRKAIAIAVAAGFLGIGTAPAFAVFPLFVPIMMSKEDKNFKAVNPYAKTVKAKGKKKKKM
jgi:hypothetical protein